MSALAAPVTIAATLPHSRGPLSEAVLDVLAGCRASSDLSEHSLAATSDPLGEDLQLALYACYELHYRSPSSNRSTALGRRTTSSSGVSAGSSGSTWPTARSTT